MSKTKLALDVVADLRSLANSIENFVLSQETKIKNEPAPKEKKAETVDTSVEENPTNSGRIKSSYGRKEPGWPQGGGESHHSKIRSQ
jgi:hypothetical protein